MPQVNLLIPETEGRNLHFGHFLSQSCKKGLGSNIFSTHRVYIAFKALHRCETQLILSCDRHCQLRTYCINWGLICLHLLPVFTKVSGIFWWNPETSASAKTFRALEAYAHCWANHSVALHPVGRQAQEIPYDVASSRWASARDLLQRSIKSVGKRKKHPTT